MSTQIGANIKARRETLGIKKHDLAIALKCYDSTVYGWEGGRRTPSIPWLLKIASALQCQPSDLLEGVV